ncbi:putative ribonuclease H-like domain-containing protein [Tanacetum coccineum]|uniref:Ribonuclease H-like domain-containing protein n=1 Tax=Tanacetum coccineum TaxID=301880 RepID=A0ABQ5BJ19_9ASTR
MAMLSLRINRFEKKAGRKMNYNNQQPARFDRRKVTAVKNNEPKALVSVIREMHGVPPSNTELYIAQAMTKSNDFVSCDNSDKSSDSETYASCDSSLKTKTKDFPPAVDIKTLPESDVEDPNSTAGSPSFSCSENVKSPRIFCNKSGMNNRNVCKNNSVRVKKCFVCGSKLHLIKDCDFYNCVDSVPCKSKAASVPAGGSDPATRNRPAVNSAGRPNPTGRVGQAAHRAAAQSNPAGWSKSPAPVSAGRPVSAGWFNPAARPYFRPSSVYFNNMYWPELYDPMYMNEGRWGTAGDPSIDNDIGIVDSGCSRSMTGNKEKLDDFVQVKGGIVKFGGGDGRISGKGTIRTSKLDFENVYYVEELQHFNLFSVSQICDKKNKVLFTDTDCLVLTEEFQLPDESQVVLRIPRERDLYTFSISELQPEQNVTCLVAKASLDESTRWHRRMAHVNFKTINKLAKEGLVDGLPLKVFTNEHNCVACNKGKQHKASYKHISAVRLITETLQLLHMDLFGPTNIRSIDQKYYSLVVTDDFSRFTWTFFLGTKDETFYVLKEFIALIENQLNKKVKGIRCDNGTEFKNAKLIELCGEKGIKRDYSNPRTPQQNGVAERKNRTLIEAARTMLADSKLPTMFWTEAVSTACYVLNRVSITNPHNKTPYELISGKVPQIGYTRFKTDKPAGSQETNINAGTQDHDSDSEVDEQVIVIMQKSLLSFKHKNMKAEVAAADIFWLSVLTRTAEIISQAEAVIRNQVVTADRDPAGIDSTGGVSAGSTSAGSDPAGGPLSSNGPSVLERNADYAEELAKLQTQEYEAKDAAARYGYLFSQETAEIISQAEAVIRNQGVTADRDPAGIDSTGGVSAGSTSAGSDPAGGNSAGSFPPADCYESAGQGNPAVSTSVSADFIPVHADESTLPPGQSLGSSENTTRFPVPSDVCKDNLSSGIFTSSFYDADFSATLTNLAPAMEVNPVPTKRVNIIHPQPNFNYLFACFPFSVITNCIAKALEDLIGAAMVIEEEGIDYDELDVKSTFSMEKLNDEVVVKALYGLIKHIEPGNAAANVAACSAAEAHLVPPSPPVSPIREPTPERDPSPDPASPPTPPALTFIFEEPVVFGPEPRPVGYVDPDVIEPIIFGPQPRPHGYVDPDFVEPIIFGPQPRPDKYLEPEDLGNIISIEDDTTHDGFHVESPVWPDDAPTPTADAAGRAEDPALLTDLSAKLDRCMGRIDSLETELGKSKKIMGGAILTLVSRVKKLEKTVKQLRETRLVVDASAAEGDVDIQDDIDLDGLSRMASTALGHDQPAVPSEDVEEQAEEEVPLRRKRSAYRRARTEFSSPAFEQFPANLSAGGRLHTAVPEPAGPSVAADKGKSPMPDLDIPAEFLAEDAQARKRFAEEQASERLVQRLRAEDLAQEDLPHVSEERAKELDDLMMRMTETDWLTLMMQVGSNPALARELLGADVNEENFIERMNAVKEKKKRALADLRYRALKGKPMKKSEVTQMMRNFVKNQWCAAHNGTITMKDVKAMNPQQLIEEYEYICRRLEKDRLLSAQYNLFRPKPAITEPPSKRQRVERVSSQPASVPAATTLPADDPDSAGGGSSNPAGSATPMTGSAAFNTAGGAFGAPATDSTVTTTAAMDSAGSRRKLGVSPFADSAADPSPFLSSIAGGPSPSYVSTAQIPIVVLFESTSGGINEFFLESDKEEQIGMSRVVADPDSDDEVLAKIIFRGKSISGDGVVLVDKLPDDEIVDPRVKVETVSEFASSPPRSRRKHLGVRSDDFLWDKPVEDFFSSESESDDDMENYIPPLPYGAFKDWEIVSCPPGNSYIHVYYQENRRRKYFTYLKQLLPHVYREDLLLLRRRMNRYFRLNPEVDVGLELWRDVNMLCQSLHPDDVEDFWRTQDDWIMSSWKLYPKSSVHVLDLTNGKTVYMFVDKFYPIRATLLERMLRHRLRVLTSYCRDVVVAGNIIQTFQAGLRQAYEYIASAPIAKALGRCAFDVVLQLILLVIDVHAVSFELLFGCLLATILTESKEEVQEESKEEESKRKRKLGTRKKMTSKEKERFIQNTSEDDKCLGTKPQDDKVEHLEEINQNVVIRSNGQKRYFSTLMRVLSIFDREDFDVGVFWGDLMVMFNPDDEDKFWNSQQDWNIVSWKLHGSSGVHTLVTEAGLVIHMLVEKKYPLRKKVLLQMLELKLESEEDSTMALELIRFVKKLVAELEPEDSNGDEEDL